jgi:hypothetical protein
MGRVRPLNGSGEGLVLIPAGIFEAVTLGLRHNF